LDAAPEQHHHAGNQRRSTPRRANRWVRGVLMPAYFRACLTCGTGFQPRHARVRHCAKCEPRGRINRSPTTQAQDGEYRRNRKVLLAGYPRCALRIRCDIARSRFTVQTPCSSPKPRGQRPTSRAGAPKITAAGLCLAAALGLEATAERFQDDTLTNWLEGELRKRDPAITEDDHA
ncbi:MAG: hypothetical protein WKF94_18960, partial [Solirubrobacteraceae bacterium]